MQSSSNIVDAFFALLRAGLWEQSVRLLPYSPVDFDALYNLAEEQSVVGVIAAGLEHVEDMTLQKQQVMPFMKQVISLESRNTAMNKFIESLVVKMNEAGICALLVKGQGVAQCYEKPLWRSCGDVDLVLNEDNYDRAKAFLTPLASSVETEYVFTRHLGMSIDNWAIELHGSLRCGLSRRMDKELNRIYHDTFYGGQVRSWNNEGVQVFQLCAENDIIYVFTHFLSHFYKGGVGLRQICDWCRLLWIYRNEVDSSVLSARVISMRLVNEWKAFAELAIEYLGMPIEAMPLHDSNRKWKRKAKQIKSFIIEVGNFGHNRDFSYFIKYPYLIRKTISLWHRFVDLNRHAAIFLLGSMRFFPNIVFNGLRSAARGE